VSASYAIEYDATEINDHNSQIDQEYSWGKLLITQELFQKLLTALAVHPGFLKVVHTFGERITPAEESFAAFFTKLHHDPMKSLHYSYGMFCRSVEYNQR
jgi:hypothetical protein